MKGNIGLGKAISFGTKMGFVVSVPLNDSQPYDLIFDIDGILNRVQVKTSECSENGGSFIVELRTTGGNKSRSTYKPFDSSKIEYLFVLVDNGDTYFIPSGSITNVKSITVGKKYTEFKC